MKYNYNVVHYIRAKYLLFNLANARMTYVYYLNLDIYLEQVFTFTDKQTLILIDTEHFIFADKVNFLLCFLLGNWMLKSISCNCSCS